MRFEIVTINYEGIEFDAKPLQFVFDNAQDLEDFLREKHSGYTSVLITVLPVRTVE
jgi:hypothetical protein